MIPQITTSYWRQTTIENYLQRLHTVAKTTNLSLTFMDLSNAGVAEMTPHVHFEHLLFLFFVNILQDHEKFLFQFFYSTGQILFD